MQWVKADASYEQIHQDLAHCQQEAWREASWRAWLYRPYAPTLIRDSAGRHFFAWPVSPFGDPFGDRFMEESRLAHFCMRAKGYQLVPIEDKAKPAEKAAVDGAKEKPQAETIQPSPSGTVTGNP